MKNVLLILGFAILFGVFLPVKAGSDAPIVVPALVNIFPPSHPCNLSPQGDGGAVEAVCITGPEKHYVCLDQTRVLLKAENGDAYCVAVNKLNRNE